MVFTTGVVPIIYTMIQAFTEPGDEIIIQQPVYHPFIHAIRDHKRTLSNNALRYENGRIRSILKTLHSGLQGLRQADGFLQSA